MKKEELFSLFSELPDEMIAEAAEDAKPSKMKTRARLRVISAAAACLCVALLGTTAFLMRDSLITHDANEPCADEPFNGEKTSKNDDRTGTEPEPCGPTEEKTDGNISYSKGESACDIEDQQDIAEESDPSHADETPAAEDVTKQEEAEFPKEHSSQTREEPEITPGIPDTEPTVLTLVFDEKKYVCDNLTRGTIKAEPGKKLGEGFLTSSGKECTVTVYEADGDSLIAEISQGCYGVFYPAS